MRRNSRGMGLVPNFSSLPLRRAEPGGQGRNPSSERVQRYKEWLPNLVEQKASTAKDANDSAKIAKKSKMKSGTLSYKESYLLIATSALDFPHSPTKLKLPCGVCSLRNDLARVNACGVSRDEVQNASRPAA